MDMPEIDLSDLEGDDDEEIECDRDGCGRKVLKIKAVRYGLSLYCSDECVAIRRRAIEEYAGPCCHDCGEHLLDGSTTLDFGTDPATGYQDSITLCLVCAEARERGHLDAREIVEHISTYYHFAEANKL